MLVRENSDVDTFGRANQAKHRIDENPISPSVVGAVPDKNLSDTFLVRKINDRGYRVVAFQYFGRGAGLFCRVEISSNCDSLSLGPAGLTHIHRVELALKTLLVAFPAFNHGRSIGIGRQADEEALVRPEDRLNAVRSEERRVGKESRSRW